MTDGTGAVLIVEQGMDDASIIPLDQHVQVIGKTAKADIQVNNPFISRRHAQFSQEKGHFLVQDLGSKNGTYVNGARLDSNPVQLRNGDKIELAEGQVVLLFQERSGTLTLPPDPSRASEGDLRVDSGSREVWVQGQQLEPRLSRKEFDVLALLYRRAGQACSKDEIAAHGWSERTQGDVGDQEIEQCIRRVRLRVEPDPSNPVYVLTVRGYGYKLAQG